MKRLLAIILIIAMAFGCVACGDGEDKVETARDFIDKVNEMNTEVKSSEFASSFTLEMSGLDEIGISEPMGLEMDGKVLDAKNMEMNMDLDTGTGMSIAASIYMKDNKMLIHAPMLSMVMGYAYMEMDMDTMNEMAGSSVNMDAEDVQIILDVINRFEEETEYSLYDIVVLNDDLEEVTVEVNGEEVDTTKLEMTVQLDGAVDVIVAFMDFIFADEEARAAFFDGYTDEEIDEMHEELKANMADEAQLAELEEALEMVDIKTFKMVSYYDEDYNAVKTEMDIDVTVEAEGEVVDIKMSGYMDVFNIGGDMTIEMPEVNPDEVLNLNDMSGMF